MRAHVGQIGDALLARLAALVLQVLRALQHTVCDGTRPAPLQPSLLTHLPGGDAVVLLDGAGRIVAVGGSADRVLGETPRLLGRAAIDHVHPDDRDTARAAWAQRDGHGCRAQDEPDPQVRIRLRAAGGVWRWYEAVSRDLRDDPEVGAVVLTLRDVGGDVASTPGSLDTKLALQRFEARRDAQRLGDIFEATHDLVGMADRHGRLLYLNGAARRFAGVPETGEIGDRRLLDQVPPDVAKRLATEILADLERDGMWSGDLAVTRHDGVVVPMLAQLLRHTDDNGDVEFFSGIMHDISSRKHYESQLAHQATHDPLTGLPNRALLLERLERALERAHRHATRVATLFLDLDHFKVVNDSLGHEAGDQVLVALAARLRRAVRPGDTVARFGGDEFVVLCADLVQHTDSVAVAERLRSVMSGPLMVGSSEVFVAVSVGIAISAPDGDDPGALIRDADAAMYRAKERGRSRSEVFDHAMRAHAVYRLDTESSLRRAEERGELQVRYQPIVSLHTGAVVGVEALLRWEHPERGLLPPGDFIHVAEETGLIVPMGAWVLERACRQVGRWQAELPDLDPLRISVNLSGRQLGQPALVSEVRDILAGAGIDPAQLELEITESVLMDDVERSSETLRALKALGVKLVVDDFGTGYSSFSYLRRFPVDVLKVDRSFVDGLGENPSDSAIVTAIVTLAHTLGLQTVAEGVETPAQLAELRRLECDLAQGFLMARPGSAEEISALLAKPLTCW